MRESARPEDFKSEFKIIRDHNHMPIVYFFKLINGQDILTLGLENLEDTNDYYQHILYPMEIFINTSNAGTIGSLQILKFSPLLVEEMYSIRADDIIVNSIIEDEKISDFYIEAITKVKWSSQVPQEFIDYAIASEEEELLHRRGKSDWEQEVEDFWDTSGEIENDLAELKEVLSNMTAANNKVILH